MLARNKGGQEMVDSFVIQYATGAWSEEVFKASLKKYINTDDIRFLVMVNQLAHRNSLAFKRGDIRS